MPDEFDVHYNCGWDLYEAGKLGEAFAEWHEASRTAPNNKRQHADLEDTLSAVADVVGGLSVVRAALEISPSSADLHNRLGCRLMAQAKAETDAVKLAEAGTAFQKVISLDPGNVYASPNLAAIQWYLKQKGEAIKTLKVATAANPNNATLLIQLEQYQIRSLRLQDAVKTTHAISNLPKSEEVNKFFADLDRTVPQAMIRLGVGASLIGIAVVGWIWYRRRG